MNTDSCKRPTACTCNSVYNQLHWEWDHTAKCSYKEEVVKPKVQQYDKEAALVMQFVRIYSCVFLAPHVKELTPKPNKEQAQKYKDLIPTNLLEYL